MERINVRDHQQLKNDRLEKFGDNAYFSIKRALGRYTEDILNYEENGLLEIGISTFKRYLALIYDPDEYRLRYYPTSAKAIDKVELKQLIKDSILSKWKNYKDFCDECDFSRTRIDRIKRTAGSTDNGFLMDYFLLMKTLGYPDFQIYIERVDLPVSKDGWKTPFNLNRYKKNVIKKVTIYQLNHGSRILI